MTEIRSRLEVYLLNIAESMDLNMSISNLKNLHSIIMSINDYLLSYNYKG
jgi:hypothetical protein